MDIEFAGIDSDRPGSKRVTEAVGVDLSHPSLHPVTSEHHVHVMIAKRSAVKGLEEVAFAPAPKVLQVGSEGSEGYLAYRRPALPTSLARRGRLALPSAGEVEAVRQCKGVPAESSIGLPKGSCVACAFRAECARSGGERTMHRSWASCAADGTLRFNWRAVMAPPAVLDYVVAHELAHLRVRGHTPEYWAVVAQAAPDYRLRRERLREVGPLLRI